MPRSMDIQSVETDPAPAENGLYLNSLDTTADEIKELKEKQKNKPTKKDIVYLSVVGALNVAVIIFLAVFLHVTGNWDDMDAIKTSVPEPEPELAFYDADEAIGASLTPTLRGVKFPDGILEKFRPIYSANEDTIGWIRLDGTSIDYPVMQSEDNNKYERADFYLNYNRRGSIWMDFRNTVGWGGNSLSKLTILYGHHLSADECIFAELEGYMDVDFYKTHPIIEMNTLYNNYKWKVFACIVSNVEPEDDNGHVFYYWDPNVTDANTPVFIDEIMRRSWFKNDAVDIEPTDKFLCLSTCTYIMNLTRYVEMRCVVFARLVRPGEDDSIDVSGAVANEDRRMPQLWYSQHGTVNPYTDVPVFNEYPG